jgi:hypothetical protein
MFILLVNCDPIEKEFVLIVNSSLVESFYNRIFEDNIENFFFEVTVLDKQIQR